MVGFAGLDRLSPNTVSGLGVHFANNGLLGNQVIQGYEAVTNCWQIQFCGESSDVAVEAIDDFFQLSVFISGIGHIADEVVHDVMKLATAAPMLLPEIVCDGDLQALGGNKDQVAVNMHGDIQATLSQFALDAGLQQSALCRHLVADGLVMVGLAVGIEQSAIFANGDVVLCGLDFHHDDAVIGEDNIVDLGFGFLVSHIDISEIPEEGTINKSQRVGNLIFCALAGHMNCDFFFDGLQATHTCDKVRESGSTILSGCTGYSGDNFVQSCGFVTKNYLACETLEFQQFLDVLLAGEAVAGEDVVGLQGFCQFSCSIYNTTRKIRREIKRKKSCAYVELIFIVLFE